MQLISSFSSFIYLMKEGTNEKLFYPKCYIPYEENYFRFLINVSGFYKTNAIASIQF
jgi:hypothetical protein